MTNLISDRVRQILDEERRYPTIRYEPVLQQKDDLGTPLMHFATLLQLTEERKRPQTHREVHEYGRYRLNGTNYDLLVVLLSQMPDNDRSSFFATLRLRIADVSAFQRLRQHAFPSWNGFGSELPLVAEFCLRNGDAINLIRALAEASIGPGLVLMLMEIEEMLTLNFAALSESAIKQLSSAAVSLYTASKEQETPGRSTNWPGIQELSRRSVCAEIDQRCRSIRDKCRKALYLYTKSTLQQNANLEVNNDRTAVATHLESLGFSKILQQSLGYAEQMYMESRNAFDLKTCVGHLRSFLEQLHVEGAQLLGNSKGGSLPKGWSPTLAHLRNSGLMSQAEEKFAAGLYALLSDQGVHPIIAEREYVRLMRNVLIEYGLLFLKRVEKAAIATQRACSSGTP